MKEVHSISIIAIHLIHGGRCACGPVTALTLMHRRFLIHFFCPSVSRECLDLFQDFMHWCNVLLDACWLLLAPFWGEKRKGNHKQGHAHEKDGFDFLWHCWNT